MFSLQRLLGKDDKFFTLMEGSAEEARASVRSLSELLKTKEEKRCLDGFVESRRKDKRITRELTEHLLKTFITPLEREDIEALSDALYKIPKTVEKFGERFMFAGEHVRNLSLSKQTAMLDKAGAGGADVVCLSENVVGRGIDGPVAERAKLVAGPTMKLLAEKAKEYRMYVVTAFEEPDGNVVYNTAVLFNRDGKLAAKYRKTHLPLAEAEMGYTPGALNRLVPDLTRRMVEKIFATDFEDWPALLRAMRETGDEFRHGKVALLSPTGAESRP